MLDCRYYDLCCFTDDSCNGEQECPKRGRCQFYSPMPDVGALEALADETEGAVCNENKTTDLAVRFAEVICTIAKEIRSVYGKYVHVVTDDEM